MSRPYQKPKLDKLNNRCQDRTVNKQYKTFYCWSTDDNGKNMKQSDERYSSMYLEMPTCSFHSFNQDWEPQLLLLMQIDRHKNSQASGYYGAKWLATSGELLDSQSSSLVQTEISHQLLDGLHWNLVRTFMTIIISKHYHLQCCMWFVLVVLSHVAVQGEVSACSCATSGKLLNPRTL